MTQEYYVAISPLFASPDKIKTYLNENGISDIKNIIPGKDNVQVYVGSESLAKEIRDKMNGNFINGSLIEATEPVSVGVAAETRPAPQPAPPAPSYPRQDSQTDRSYNNYRPQESYNQRSYPQRNYESRPYSRDDRRKDFSRDGIRPSKDSPSRTILIYGYRAPLTRRMVWDDFRSFGYIKQIEIRETTAYVQFETPDDALNAIKQMEAKDNIVRNTRISIELTQDRPLNLPTFVIPLIVEDDKNSESSKSFM
ncbi:hypothetical protein TVAG_136760 [Trichomonas vaginalis G3]|uniref:RRM domain-containing protein n=1 Tax=Trichomonas vaginalis (strain ATCC PRA-98 / G3) TaxID=412133 RepID=A2DJF8_TRIV3|nr:RNA-binding domain, RBD family-containing protein [Trichomonas vaginalis G3]EAY19545.1 hypothetical protein TVAG_136760 [Trichomonas vaginalis G3]KAI5519973.1 RNA-binding domain, RBD family-containing protein [Trichomonas vaginalis G3]|eukprot:XP_001580531.1 hypothetical protein [Trichomonas vaginalis G3]